MNNYFRELHGDKIGSKCYDVYPAGKGGCDDCPVQEAFSTGELITIERNTVLPDGHDFFFEHIASPIRDAGGEISSCVEIIKDITQRKKSQEALRESEEKLRLIFSSISEVTIVLDLKGIVLDVNDKLLELHGLKSRDDIIGKNGLQYIVPEDHHKLIEAGVELLSSGSPKSIEVTALRKGSGSFTGEISLAQ